MLVVLASKSPRRREILTFAGIPFVVREADVEEVRAAGERAADYVRRLARDKSRAVEMGAGEVVLAADTTVVVDDPQGNEIVLEKPVDADDARRMLHLLEGRVHRVLTGVCLRHSSKEIVDVATTLVRFVPMTASEIDEYVASGESMDKAGAYAIQGRAAKFVDSVDGCYFNVMGLPISVVYRLLKKFS
ncbi:MAG TPA: Maf family protein [Bryobacteraceae bacterium]|jgi:septum formation protein